FQQEIVAVKRRAWALPLGCRRHKSLSSFERAIYPTTSQASQTVTPSSYYDISAARVFSVETYWLKFCSNLSRGAEMARTIIDGTVPSGEARQERPISDSSRSTANHCWRMRSSSCVNALRVVIVLGVRLRRLWALK